MPGKKGRSMGYQVSSLIDKKLTVIYKERTWNKLLTFYSTPYCRAVVRSSFGTEESEPLDVDFHHKLILKILHLISQYGIVSHIFFPAIEQNIFGGIQ